MRELLQNTYDFIHTHAKVIDYVAVGTTVGVLTSWLPPVAAAFSIAWLGTQLWDYWFVKRKALNGDLGHEHLDTKP